MLSLNTKQRDELLTIYRKDPDPELRFRAHIILLLGEGHPWDTIEAMLFCSSRTVDRWLKRFQAEGVAGLTGKKRGRPFRLGVAAARSRGTGRYGARSARVRRPRSGHHGMGLSDSLLTARSLPRAQYGARIAGRQQKTVTASAPDVQHYARK